MKNKSIIESKRDGFEGQYNELSISQMMNIRGGDTPPPIPPGDDYPIRPCMTDSTQLMPILE